MRADVPSFVFLVLFTSKCDAFVSPTMTRCKRVKASSHLFGMMKPREEHEGQFDLEAARRRLEAMMGGEENSSGQAVQERTTSSAIQSQQKTPAPPLTAIARERRIAEIQLISQLEDSDDSLSDLWSLWFGERGTEAAVELMRAEKLTKEGPRKFDEAEDRLRKLISKHGVHWAEPVNRLATLLYLQGRFEESKALCETVLDVKPWHVGALSGIVLVCAAMGDASAARQWAARRLPPIQPSGTNRRRKEWVLRSLEDARESLAKAEEQVRKSFGAPDVLPVNSDHDEDNDAWQ